MIFSESNLQSLPSIFAAGIIIPEEKNNFDGGKVVRSYGILAS